MKRSIRNSRNKSRNYGVYILAIGAILTSIALAATVNAKSSQNEATWQGKVISITDGDTVTVLTNTNEQVKIRVYGIDCPEKKQAFGTKAKQFLSSLIFGQTVTVQPLGKDLYGRTIAKIAYEGRDIGLTMIQYGYAWWYQQYAMKEIDYKKAQAKAREQQLGLWQDANPVEPWKFRKYKTKSEDKQ